MISNFLFSIFQSTLTKKSAGNFQQGQNWSFNGIYWNVREGNGAFDNYFTSRKNTDSNANCPPKLW